jgi:alpha,alpha-trehalose phosphorylase
LPRIATWRNSPTGPNAPSTALCYIGETRLFEEQRLHYEAFWQRADVEIEGDPQVQQALRFSLFQVRQATARAEGHGVPAKGLTGQGYEGHYFWDGGIYVLPYVIYTDPRLAGNLLHFHWSQLDRARAHARELGHAGLPVADHQR